VGIFQTRITRSGIGWNGIAVCAKVLQGSKTGTKSVGGWPGTAERDVDVAVMDG